MATMVKEIIDQARDYHPQFGIQAIPDLPVLKALERLQRQLAQAVIAENPEALGQWFVIEGLPTDWETGIPLPESLLVMGGEVYYDEVNETWLGERWWKLTLVGAKESLTHPEDYPAAYVMDGRLYLSDLRKWYGDEHGWEDMVRIRIHYVPSPEPLNKLESLLSLPDSAVSAIVANLALWMASRTSVNLPLLAQEANSSGAGWLAYMTNSGSGRAWQIEVVE